MLLPAASGIEVISPYDVKEQVSRTYYLDKQNERIISITDDYIKAVEQAVYMILSIERYDYVMYSWNYGIELRDLFGRERQYVIPMLTTRIKEALIQDERIESVGEFKISINKSVYSVSFKVSTQHGDITIKDVRFSV